MREQVATWHQLDAKDVLDKLQSSAQQGLNDQQVASRQQELGLNELVDFAGRSPWQILAEQLSGAMVLLLIVAAAVSAVLHEYTDSIVILAIVVLNAALGFAQDYRAERALAALRRLSVPVVRVRRNGHLREISARDLVPGDVVQLEVGNYVPADCRLVDNVNIHIDESALTGESVPIEKQVAALSNAALPLGDRTNLVFMGTVVTKGHGTAVVTETGMATQLGHIAQSLQSVETEPTPLQRRLAQLGRTLALAALAIVAVVFVLGVLRGEEPRLMVMTALSLAVAVVPEGLPAVATVALALGARRMFRHHALIRKLPAVETLGSVDVICSDKTGTLTENRMTVQVLDVSGHEVDVTESLERDGVMDVEPAEAYRGLRDRVAQEPSLVLLLSGASLCNDAQLETDDQGRFHALGDPTEGALCVVGADLGFANHKLAAAFPRIDERPFDSERKRMTTVHQIKHGDDEPTGAWRLREVLSGFDGECVIFTKGAVDTILDVCDKAWYDGAARLLDPIVRERIESSNAKLASCGMRVLGVAVKGLPDAPGPDASIESELTFVGLIGMIDPPRPEVAQAVQRCRAAGIRPLMITGDHPLTAQHIAAQLDVSDGPAVTGQALEGISDTELKQTVEETSVYARVAPKHKLRLVQALQDNGHVVAMTGDGVNDAPALKQAHIGVAMGITGTDVSKEASQMVLLDDNFATIVNAVEQGRIVYDNIRKFVKYTMTSNAGEIWVMVFGSLIGMPVPLLPLQILWVNLVTDGLPGIALAVERAERDTMRRPPYPPDEHLFSRSMARDIGWIGLLMGFVSLSFGIWVWRGDSHDGDAYWRTIVFTTLTLAQMGNALAIRSNRDSLFQIGVFSNPFLIASVALTFILQLAVVYVPGLQRLFQTTSLSAVDFCGCVLLSTVVFWAVELQKWLMRSRSSNFSS